MRAEKREKKRATEAVMALHSTEAIEALYLSVSSSSLSPSGSPSVSPSVSPSGVPRLRSESRLAEAEALQIGLEERVRALSDPEKRGLSPAQLEVFRGDPTL